MSGNKRWIHHEISEAEIERLSKEAGISSLLAKVLLRRGISDAALAHHFLHPSLKGLNDPYLLNDMDKAVERIVRALEKKEKIVVYGDYDVDGVTGTAVLTSFLQSLGSEAEYYIPDRLEEGYGLSMDTAGRVCLMHPKLVITVDCGITSFEETTYLMEQGTDVIITDHHECREELPAALAVINPCRHDSTYPFKELAGVGVVLKLVTALCLRLGIGEKHLEYLDLVTLGTVADVVPLTEENRIIVRHGLKAVEGTGNIGLKALMEVSGLKDKPMTTFGISFGLAPRINAAGRTGDARRAVRLFTTRDPGEAQSIAEELNEENKFRQETEAEILRQVLDSIQSRKEFEKSKVLVVAGESWHHGVIGIVASKITERFYKPCILISSEGNTGKGSGRSIEGFNLFAALNHCASCLEGYGGHEMAAGLTLDMGKLEAFRDAINRYADLVLSEEDLLPKVEIDAYIDKHEISIENINGLALLEPFGAGNPGPRFGLKDIRLVEIRTVGEDKHLKLRLEKEGALFDAIGFNMGALARDYRYNDRVDLAFSLEINTWNSVQKPQMNLKDIRLNDLQLKENGFWTELDKNIEFDNINDYNIFIGTEVERIIPERQDLAAIYQYLKTSGHEEVLLDNLFEHARRIENGYKIPMNYLKLKKGIEIFQELMLLNYKPAGEYGMYVVLSKPPVEKTDLKNSKLYRKLQEMKNHCVKHDHK